MMGKKHILTILVTIIVIGTIQVIFSVEPIPNSPYVLLSQGNLAYTIYNKNAEGTPVIIIHGSPGSKNEMGILARAIKNRPVYALDMFCFGDSTKRLNDCGMDTAAKTIKEFMDSQQIPQATILGYSWGGSVGITFAYKFPKKIKTLILLSGNGIQEGEPTGSYYLERIRSYISYPFVVYYPGAFAGGIGWRRGFMKSFLDSDQRVIENELTKIKTESLILHGKKDTVIEPWVAEKQSSLIQNAKLEWFEGDHMTVFSDVNEIAPKINTFLVENE